MRLVEVERHAPRHHLALHGAPVAGDLTSLALEVARDIGVWTKLDVSPSHVYVTFYEIIDVNVPELGTNVAFHWAFDIHVPETRVDIALYFAGYEDVAERSARRPVPVRVLRGRRPGGNVVFDASMAHHHIADQPLFSGVRGKRQEYDEAEDHDREGKQG